MCFSLFTKREPIITIIKPCGCKVHYSNREAFHSLESANFLSNSINGITILVRCENHKEIYDSEIKAIHDNRIARRKAKYEKKYGTY